MRRLLISLLAVALLSGAAGAAAAPAVGAAPAGASAAVPSGHAPIVLFPAFHLTKLRIVVSHQRTDPRCPASGSFIDLFDGIKENGFSQVCRDELMTLRYRSDPLIPMPHRFSEQPGVQVQLAQYGSVASAPFYQPMYDALEAAGWTADKDIRVAGYDARLTPDQGGFLGRTVKLIESTYAANGDRRVFLVGHSNGPLYAQYLLTHTSHAWRAKYIAGFTPIAGNLPGQGLCYLLPFLGLNIADFTFPATAANAISSARMYLTAPSTYMSSSDPRVFGRSEVVVHDNATGLDYTPVDHRQLFRDAGLRRYGEIADYYIGFVKFTDPAHFPDVDVWAERGSGLDTAVGAALPNLQVGQLTTPSTTFYTQSGDSNQEDTTNTATLAWERMRGFHYSLTDNPGVGHFDLPSNASVLTRLVAHAGAAR